MPELNHERETINHFLELYLLEKERFSTDNLIINFMPYFLTLKEDEKIDIYELSLVISLFANDGKHIATLEAPHGLVHYFYLAFAGERTGVEIRSYKFKVWWETSWFNVSEFFDF